ncbi:MAG: ATP synthase F1 subunit delta [Prolixibacteraceae bacterium]|nr:ATP synthase F1 subunit delta [Prolixibacteraceae bacterium]
MNDGKISSRYAKALFEVAVDLEVPAEVCRDMREIEKICAESHEFALFLNNMLITKSHKAKMMRKIFDAKIQPLTLRFLLLTVEKSREPYLAGICRNFIDRYRKYRNIIPVSVTTAGELSPEAVGKIKQHLALQTGATIELSERINPAIIGGLILQIGDYQYDGSIARQLKRVKGDLLGKK